MNKSVSLENKDYVKYLGILVDKNLTWKTHVNNIATKIGKTVGLIAKLRHFVPFHTLLNIYRSLIMPYLTFGITCWGQACNTYLNKILVIQKEALRCMYFVERKTHAIPLFMDAKILPVSFLYYRSTAVILHDIHTNLAPKNFVNLFVNVSDVHTYSTRSSAANRLYRKKFNLKLQEHSLQIYGVKLWNEIPASLRNKTKSTFKRSLNSYLFTYML